MYDYCMEILPELKENHFFPVCNNERWSVLFKRKLVARFFVIQQANCSLANTRQEFYIKIDAS